MRKVLILILVLLLFTNKSAVAQEVKVSDDTVFRARGTAGISVFGDKELRQDEKESEFLSGELDAFWKIYSDKEKSLYLVGFTGGYRYQQTDLEFTKRGRREGINSEYAFGAVSFSLLNREASILRGELRLDFGAAFRELFASEAMFYSHGAANGQLSLLQPVGIYAGVEGSYLQGKSNRHEYNGEAHAGLHLFQDLGDPNVLHFRFASLGVFASYSNRRDQDHPFTVVDEKVQWGPEAMLDFGTLVVRLRGNLPAIREVMIKQRGQNRVREDQDGAYGATLTFELYF